MLVTTAVYDETPFMEILKEVFCNDTMLDSRKDPTVPLVVCTTSKMSSTPTSIALLRNYNYAGGELPDPFTIDADRARLDLGLPLEGENEVIRSAARSITKEKLGAAKDNGSLQQQGVGGNAPENGGSRHPGSFRVLQRYALRASTAAPTVFKPVVMGGEMYCDGGIVASNPSAVAIHEARTLFPDVPIELVVSIGTGGFFEQKSEPRIGWDVSCVPMNGREPKKIHALFRRRLNHYSYFVSSSILSFFSLFVLPGHYWTNCRFCH